MSDEMRQQRVQRGEEQHEGQRHVAQDGQHEVLPVTRSTPVGEVNPGFTGAWFGVHEGRWYAGQDYAYVKEEHMGDWPTCADERGCPQTGRCKREITCPLR